MKFNRIAALMLALVIMLSAHAFAGALEWNFGGSTGPASSAGAGEIVQSNNCAMHLAPFGTAQKMFDVPSGATVYPTGEESIESNGTMWIKVEYFGSRGWIKADALNQQQPAFEYVTNDFVVISGGDCNVRVGAGTSFEKIGAVKEGQVLKALGGNTPDERGVYWVEIQLNGMSGWVSSKYGKLNNTAGMKFAIVNSSGAVMRSDATPNSSFVTSLSGGAAASFLGQVSFDNLGNGWLKVQYQSNTGWVCTDEVKLSTSSAPKTSSSKGYVKATSHKVNMRDVPNLSGRDIGTMDKGETATYLGQKSTDSRGVVWYKVSFAGKTGWVSSKYTKLYN